MPQLSLYVSDENLEYLRRRSRETGLSLSKYANKLIEEDAASGSWPEGFWDLYGAIDDDAFCAPDDPAPEEEPDLVRAFG